MISTTEMRKAFHKEIKAIKENKTYREMALNAEVTETTIQNAVTFPDRIKLETLERIVEANK